MPGGVGIADGATLDAIEAGLRKFNIQLWTFYAFAVIITCLRTYSRFKAVGLKNFRPDDFIVWIAIVSKIFAVLVNRSNIPVIVYGADYTCVFRSQLWSRTRE
jgi:hypothetical protein